MIAAVMYGMMPRPKIVDWLERTAREDRSVLEQIWPNGLPPSVSALSAAFSAASASCGLVDRRAAGIQKPMR